MRKLSDVDIGKFAKVKELLAEGLLRERMLALGITRGLSIEVVRRGPSGDPTVYYIRGAMIALRKEEAELISVYEN